MSQYFMVGDLVLWNPASRVAELFVRSGEAIAPLVGLATGIGAVSADEYEIDLDTFAAFVDALAHHEHPILKALLEGFTAAAVVLIERAGRGLPALPGRLRLLADECAPAMPV